MCTEFQEVNLRIMIQRAKNVIRLNPGKRILCIVGADHNYLFRDELLKESFLVKYPLT